MCVHPPWVVASSSWGPMGVGMCVHPPWDFRVSYLAKFDIVFKVYMRVSI